MRVSHIIYLPAFSLSLWHPLISGVCPLHTHSLLLFVYSPYNNQSDIVKAQICSCHPHCLKPFKDSQYSDPQVASVVLGLQAPRLILHSSDTYFHHFSHLHLSIYEESRLCAPKGLHQAIFLPRIFLSASILHICLHS